MLITGIRADYCVIFRHVTKLNWPK